MNFSFASAPTTPFISQVDSRSPGGALSRQQQQQQFLSPPLASSAAAAAAAAAAVAASNSLNVAALSASLAAVNGIPAAQQQPFSALPALPTQSAAGDLAINRGNGMPRIIMSRATDPINDIGSPINLQYLQYAMSGGSPFLMATDASISGITSPVSAPITMPPKQQQLPSLVISSSSPSAMAGTSSSATAAAAIANAISSSMGSPPMATPYAPHAISQPPSAKALSPANLGNSGAANDTGSPLPGFFHPAEVFTTPETRTVHEPIGMQATPELALFDDADAIGVPDNGLSTTSAAMIAALSPRTQTAQAGLSLLAASATYARDAASLTPEMAFSAPNNANTQQQGGMLSESQETVALGGSTSPFLTARGENATLMSQPHNSLAHNLSPRLVDRGATIGAQLHAAQRHSQRGNGFVSPNTMFVTAPANVHPAAGSGVPGMATLTAGRLTRNRTLLRQSSGLTSASFHNDLVPQATESFFAPLDEVCSDGGGADQSFVSQNGGNAGVGARQTSAASVGILSTAAPPMGTQFSPAMPMANGVQTTQADWQNNMTTYYNRQQRQLGLRVNGAAQASGQPTPRSAPDTIFSQMPSLGASSALAPHQNQSQAIDSGLASGLKRARINQDGSFQQDDDSVECDSEDDGSEAAGSLGKRRRTHDPNSTPHKRDQERRFDCDVCNRSFARQYNLKTHRLTHFPDANESRPFKCLHCIKAFTRKHDLQRHASLHKRADKYSCPQCHRGFQRKDALKRHTDTECMS
ncbi:hypothetical protein IW140_005278 [Coemansia sp. RSA 1813]|nr:hypothetical protein EV178_005782 [Coemansia sp. RSA 1646]KAJ1768778.1 hypothetical protein LPJ74_004578 [Coemansia sp. RSA 1843]KAJ2212306.1 hypothetical protein EV179_004776 [Coemansia sp. RSA 487]KAJ2565589.1 hypothetical protein IW140_005278 [Coemansia sp. RSA 1813]